MSANILPHLLELRRRSILILLWFAVLFAAFFFMANELFQVLVSPLLHTLLADNELIVTQIASPVFTPLKLAADAALLLTAPFALFHLWRFISPGLYQKEQRALRSALILSLLLFLAGVTFCYYLVLPFMFQFFIHALPKGVRYMPDMAYALDFITRMLLLFGLCFQVPLICLTLVRLTLLDVATLKKIRPYVIVGAFIIGMLLTPPDVFSQIMLAVPLCLLYETGIILTIYFV
ncbi:twin-arginine translocase subunit TatC [Legionella rowbothamii]|uniref:twin-arginine translocase subunit TatC n=1 Tax=Legionella rowbothamii TaxID=96229 RepID=UPI0013EF71D2|nr:twin-arginine translocase subunit TatC [Legionella rowbothamii]